MNTTLERPQSATAAHTMIADFAESKAKNETRVVPSLLVGQTIRQGDVYLTRIESFKQKDYVAAGEQLAPGNSQGSRHCVDLNAGVKCWKKKDGRVTEGPIVEAEGRFTLTHPEHAHFDLPGGIYQVTFQLDYATQQRARD